MDRARRLDYVTEREDTRVKKTFSSSPTCTSEGRKGSNVHTAGAAQLASFFHWQAGFSAAKAALTWFWRRRG